MQLVQIQNQNKFKETQNEQYCTMKILFVSIDISKILNIKYTLVITCNPLFISSRLRGAAGFTF